MAKPGNTGFKRVVRATGYSAQGLLAAARHEAAFRQELALSVLMIPAAFYVGKSAVEWALLISMVVLVLIVELLNSAIEAVVDRVGAETHELSGRAKDIGSAAVMVSLALVAAVWGLLIFENFFTQ
jgi:diacylglycerol kinase (ATP)